MAEGGAPMRLAPGSLTDVPGIEVGHADDARALTGCTVVVCRQGAIAGGAVFGLAPGTRETDLLRAGTLVTHVHAVLLTGGSAFGLAAADGVMRYLEEHGVGYDTGVARVDTRLEGATLADGAPTDIPKPSTRFFLRRLQSGRVLLVNNLDAKQRVAMTAMLSEDDGRSWPYQLTLENSTGSSYPDAIQAPDGGIHIIYDRGGRNARKEIVTCRICEDDIIAGKITAAYQSATVIGLYSENDFI